MSAGLGSIALFTPIIASNAVFSARRASRGVDAIGENPLYAAMNFDIAAAQTLKGARAVKGLAIANNSNISMIENGAKEMIKTSSSAGKALKGLGKVISLTADYINPVICLTSGVKVFKSDDKIDEGARESIKLGCMFGSEKAMKSFAGMPYTERINGKIVTKTREGYYKKLFSKKQLEAIKDFSKTKKFFKYAPGLKGLLFVGASITGYQVGEKLSDLILGKKPVKEKAN